MGTYGYPYIYNVMATSPITALTPKGPMLSFLIIIQPPAIFG